MNLMHRSLSKRLRTKQCGVSAYWIMIIHAKTKKNRHRG